MNLIAGLIAYIVAFLVAVIPLAHWTFFRLAIAATKSDEEDLLRQKNLAVAIDLGSTIICQSILARHAVFAIMAVVRGIFVEELAAAEKLWVILRSFLVLFGLTAASFFSIWLASRIFRGMTKRLNEEQAIKDGNVAVAVFSGLALLAIAIILNDGMEDLSRSLIPYARSGIIQ